MKYKVGDKVVTRFGVLTITQIEYDNKFNCFDYLTISDEKISRWLAEDEITTIHDKSVTTKTDKSGVKFDKEKLQWWYMWQFLPELEQVASVLQYGDTKYPAEDGSNWKRLDNLERRASSAAMRHLSSYLKGDKLDDETKNSHLAHCITNLLFLMYNDRSINQVKGE